MPRYTAICVVGVVTVDEQTASNFTSLWVKACHDAAKALQESPAFDGAVETYEIEDHDIPPRSPS